MWAPGPLWDVTGQITEKINQNKDPDLFSGRKCILGFAKARCQLRTKINTEINTEIHVNSSLSNTHTYTYAHKHTPLMYNHIEARHFTRNRGVSGKKMFIYG